LIASLVFHDVETRSFLILFILFVVAVELNEMDRLNAWEIMFMVYALGFSLEKAAAMQEHGIRGNVFHPLPVRRLLNVAAVFFTGTWVRDDYIQRCERAHDSLEWI
jgi:hypothetical protein